MRSRSIRSDSTRPRRRVGFAARFLHFDRGDVAERGELIEPLQIVLRHFQRLGGRELKLRALLRGLQIGLGLLELTRGRLIGDRGQEFAFLERLPDRGAARGERIGQPNETGVLRPHRNEKSGLDPDRAVNGRDGGAAPHHRHFRDGEKLEVNQNEEEEQAEACSDH